MEKCDVGRREEFPYLIFLPLLPSVRSNGIFSFFPASCFFFSLHVLQFDAPAALILRDIGEELVAAYCRSSHTLHKDVIRHFNMSFGVNSFEKTNAFFPTPSCPFVHHLGSFFTFVLTRQVSQSLLR